MEVTHGLSDMGFRSPGLTWLQPLLGAVGTNTEPWYEPIPQVDQQLLGGQDRSAETQHKFPACCLMASRLMSPMSTLT